MARRRDKADRQPYYLATLHKMIDEHEAQLRYFDMATTGLSRADRAAQAMYQTRLDALRMVIQAAGFPLAPQTPLDAG